MNASGPMPSEPTDPGADADVHFFELAGPGARAALAPLAEAWRAAGADVEVLVSVDRDDLWLLVARGHAEPPASALPAGARVWRFRGAPA